uniref:Peroxidase n=1 Tax=Kalanchoe fedtschenkoi TaxID=63787 RepID=A0A7N0VDY9_KALFE
MASKFSLCFLPLLFTSAHLVSCQLDPNYYSKTCPQLHSIVAAGLKNSLKTDPRIAASLLRLHYTDCFVNGCEASILLDDTEGFKGEKNSVQSRNSLRGFEVIDSIKAEVEKACSSTVSCADILTLAAKESVVMSGGTSWEVPLGRRDGKTASEKAADEQLPPPTESLTTIYRRFAAKGLNATDLVVLSAAHSIGFAKCSSFSYRLHDYHNTGRPDPFMNPNLLKQLQAACPDASADGKLYPADPGSPYSFDLSYYNNLLSNGGVLESDLAIMTNRLSASWVVDYAKNQEKFFNDFVASMIRLGNLGVITAPDGEIRKKCGSVN